MTTFWDTDTFHEYERLCGDEPGTRARLLASADFKTRVVDLSLSEAELWRGVRHSYRSLIHKAECEYVIQSVSGGYIYSAMKIHDDEAGRHTRPLTTWTMMGEWITAGNGLLVMVGQRQLEDVTMMGDDKPKLIPVGLVELFAYAFLSVYGHYAYYFSAAAQAPDVTHALIWHAMKALKARGVRWLELGWMAREDDTEKDRQISFLKRGFGGYDIPAKEAPALCG